MKESQEKFWSAIFPVKESSRSFFSQNFTSFLLPTSSGHSRGFVSSPSKDLIVLIPDYGQSPDFVIRFFTKFSFQHNFSCASFFWDGHDDQSLTFFDFQDVMRTIPLFLDKLDRTPCIENIFLLSWGFAGISSLSFFQSSNVSPKVKGLFLLNPPFVWNQKKGESGKKGLDFFSRKPSFDKKKIALAHNWLPFETQFEKFLQRIESLRFGPSQKPLFWFYLGHPLSKRDLFSLSKEHQTESFHFFCDRLSKLVFLAFSELQAFFLASSKS